MKAFLILLLLASGAVSGTAQKMLIAAQAELTVVGYQYGSSMLFETRNLWGFGGFYQTTLTVPHESSARSSFYGILMQAPLAKTERLSFFVTLRGGLANKQFVVVTPGLETRIAVGKRLCVAMGMGMRMNYPAISSKLIIKLF